MLIIADNRAILQEMTGRHKILLQNEDCTTICSAFANSHFLEADAYAADVSVGTRNKIVQYFKKTVGAAGKVIATDMSELAPAVYEADKSNCEYRIPNSIEIAGRWYPDHRTENAGMLWCKLFVPDFQKNRSDQ